MRWLGISEGHHELSHEPDTNEKAVEKLHQDQHMVLRADGVPGEASRPRRRSRAAKAACSTTRSIVWTNELGKGNSHTLDNIPFVLVGNGLDFKMGRSFEVQQSPAQPLLLSLAHAFGHRSRRSATRISAAAARWH